jgi:hypothetical protein
MWQQDTAPSIYSWQEVLSYCENLTLAGYNDWRLPNVNELQSIVDYSRYDPAIDPIFTNTMLPFYWSSTTNANNPNNAWIVNFNYGNVHYYYKSSYNYVRAVRPGQSGSLTTTTTTVQPCPTEEIYGEYSEQTELLRYLRDNVLSTTPEGRELIRLYYELSPVIIKMMNEDEEFKGQVREMIDMILELNQD